MKVISAGNSESNSLTYGKSYEVIGIEADSYRIVNDLNDSCLYEPSHSEISDPTEPIFWVSSLGEDGERYAYPSSWSSPVFFEDFHDHIAAVVSQFWQEYRNLYG